VTEGPLGRAETARLLDRHGIHPRRALGQHFLAEPNVVRRIVEISGVGPGSRVLEIGAGAGTLTRGLAEAGAAVTAIEVDERLRPLLEESLAGLSNIDLRFEDATRVDLASLLGDERWVVVANLPYNVGTPLVLDLLRSTPQVVRLVVMLQREAVERIAAPPGTRAYGLPSVVARLHADVTVALRVAPTVFIPTPKVESAVAVLERRRPPPHTDRAVAIAAAAFGQRRKMIRRSLRSVLADPGSVLAAAGVEPTARAEDLSPEDYLRLAEASGA
jgi:16S rRNA (adenine1518-N6/adenine1519-N6)-dimethyltransferase